MASIGEMTVDQFIHELGLLAGGGGAPVFRGGGLSTHSGGYTTGESFRKSLFSENPNDLPYAELQKSTTYLDVLEKRFKGAKRTFDREIEEAYEKYKDSETELLEAKIAAFEKYERKRAEISYAFERKVRGVQNLDKNIKNVGNSLKEFGGLINQLTDAWGKADHAASSYAKSVAMSAKGMEALRDNTIGNINSSKIGIKFDTSAEELLKLQQNYADSIGRNIGISDENQVNIAAMNKVMGDRGSDMMVKLENFGLSINDAAEMSGKMFSTASKYGLDFTKYSKNFLDNITIAQNYTFKNGLKGLESMARKATALKLDMAQVAQFAEKVQTVEGAMDVASKLQVLGGAFSGLADPLGMLNEGLNDMEGLTDRLTGMIKGMGTFNQKTGEIEVSTFNKQRIKAAASAMGMSYDSLMKTVNAGARREEVDRQIRVSGKAGLSDDMKELIRNTATIQNGEAGVSINGKFTKIGDLTNDNYDELIAQTRSESENIQDIATNLRSLKDIQSGFKKQLDNQMAGMMGWLGNLSKIVISAAGSIGAILFAINAGKIASGLLSAGSNAYGSIGRWINQYKYKGINPKEVLRKPASVARGAGGAAASGGTGAAGAAGSAAASGVTTVSRTASSATSTASTVASGATAATPTTPSPAAPRVRAPRKMGIGRKTTRGLLKVMGKSSTGRAIASSVGRNLVKGGVIGTVAGLAGEGLGIWRDSRIANGKGKKGDSADSWMTVGSSALKWAGIGSAIGMFIPGIGSAIGAGIGAVGGTIAGLVQKGKRKAEANLETALSTKGLTAQGKYKKKEMKAITKAIATGKIDDETKTKLIAQGDSAIVDEIDKRRIKEAKIASIGVTPMKSNGNEEVKLSPSARMEREDKPKEINLNIDGKLRLEGANGKGVDVTKELMAALKDPSFIKNTLIPIIMKGLNESKYGTNVPSGINRYAIV